MPVNHYENFPVASALLPAHLRKAVEAIYWFARTADDYADEGELPAAERLTLLDGLRQGLHAIERGATPDTPVLQKLAETIKLHRLPFAPFHDLLSAFTQDVTRTRYANLAELLDYCRRSANPIGRLLLELYDAASPRNLDAADNICSSLQIINFLQDVAVDYANGRIYLPQDELASFGVSEAQIGAGSTDGAWRALMQFQVQRARRMLWDGAPLALALRGRIALELRLIVAGGDRILAKIRAADGDVFRKRPVLRSWDWLIMLGCICSSRGFRHTDAEAIRGMAAPDASGKHDS